MKSLYKTPESKAEILAIYQAKLEELNIDYVFRKVDTALGSTNVIVTGEATKPPLVLIHGSNGCAPIALELFPNLTERFQVFAVDVVAQPNRSSETRPSMKDDSYGKWMNEVINRLGLKSVTLLGFSFGGFVIWKTLLADEANIREAFMLAPVGLINGNPLKLIFKLFIPMRRYMSSKKTKFLEKFLSASFTEKDDFAFNFLSKVLPNFEMDFSPIPTIKSSDAKNITTPITLIAAKHDLMGPGEKMIKKAKQLFPSLKATKLLENAKHVPGAADNKVIEQMVLDSI